MVFESPDWVPQLPYDPPDTLSIEQFLTSDALGVRPLATRRSPFTCGLTGRSYTWPQAQQRTDHLARALAQRLGWQPNEGTAWDKVAVVFSHNAVDYLTVLFAIHRFSGIASPANAAYAAAEFQHQLAASGAQVVFTCRSLLATALQATRALHIPDSSVFLIDVPGVSSSESESAITSVDDLIAQGAALPPLDPVRWPPGQGARQPAYLCFSSGTSGLPKGVMISHRNVIANVLQLVTFEAVARRLRAVDTQSEIGLLPFSHIYGLVVIAHAAPFRGDTVVVLPKFELETFLAAIQAHRIQQLRVVPPIILRLLRTQDVCARYDLSSVRFLYTGAAPTGQETVNDLRRLYPAWTIGQGYGTTETATVVCTTSEHDTYDPSSGSLVRGTRAKLIGPDGAEITAYDTPGELLVQGPTITLGYLNNEKATAETYVHHHDGRWLRTGDEVVVTRAPASGHEHLIVVDRIKELIKVKGHQVAPAELEAHLLTHPAVADAAVIPVPDDTAGEVPKAFVVRNPDYASLSNTSDADVAREIAQYVQDHKTRYKWLKGGVEFIDAIPKNPSGKILRRLLRDQEKAKRRKDGSKL